MKMRRSFKDSPPPPVAPVRPATDKPSILLASLTTFFSDRTRFELMRDVVGRRTPISLRLLDWLVTNYAKKRAIIYMVDEKLFVLYDAYKNQLKCFSKRLFDPFCRRERVRFCPTPADEADPMITTPAQLMFFRWAIQHDVIRFCLDHAPAIEADMMASLPPAPTDAPTSPTTGRKRRRREINTVPNLGCSIKRIDTTLDFSLTK